MPTWLIASAALGYICCLFAVAWYGDRRTQTVSSMPSEGFGRSALAYSLTLMVYLTAWSFYGSVGRAATRGYDFTAVYAGPILVLLIGRPLLRKVITTAKEQNVTSIADFIAARYGKSQLVAALVTVVSVIALLPYIALQLKAVSVSWDILTTTAVDGTRHVAVWNDNALGITFFMAVFSILFGIRHIQASEHHQGLMLAIAFESVIKLLVLAGLTLFVVFGLFDDPWSILRQIGHDDRLQALAPPQILQTSWWANLLLAGVAFLCLPHMFHVVVVESHDVSHVRTSAKLLPPYMMILTACVIPVAAAGLLRLGPTVDPDTYTLTLPLSVGRYDLGTLAFIGGFSAATGMVIVAAVALSTMVCNDLVVPLLLRRNPLLALPGRDLSQFLLRIRRWAVVVILLMAFATYRLLDKSQSLVSIGLLSFVAVAQFGPAFFIGLYWRGGSRLGAIGALCIGEAVWFYTLFLPALFPLQALPDWIAQGPWGLSWMAPHALFGLSGLDPVSHATVWSLLLNLLTYLGVSLMSRPSLTERAQASAFVTIALPPPRGRRDQGIPPLKIQELVALASRYVGRQHALQAFIADKRYESWSKRADTEALRFTERLLAGAIGSASARVVMTAALQDDGLSLASARALLDEASAAIQYNRDLLVATLDSISQGICVFDRDFRITTWNNRFIDLCGLPTDLVRVGMPLGDLVRFNQSRGEYRDQDLPSLAFYQNVATIRWPYVYERHRPDGTVLEICFTRMAEGGFVATYTDVTERHRSAEAMARAYAGLEERVTERTLELARAKTEAEQANLAKTRFLAAASHDLLQPLSACRLFLAALCERLEHRLGGEGPGDDSLGIARHAANSLQSGEHLLTTLLDISALDGSSVKPQRRDFPVETILGPLRTEFGRLAAQRGLRFLSPPCTASIHSDPNLLRRVLQNFLSNAVRYTSAGGVVLGCRRRDGCLRIEVWDTGIGIPEDKQDVIFEEFTRLGVLASGAEKGLGLGLAIVQRIAAVLGHPIAMRSRIGHGSVFGVSVPIGTAQPAKGSPMTEDMSPDPLQGLRVLCLDNDPEILKGLEVLLRGWGCDVVAASGDDVDGLAPAFIPEAVIVDYHLDNGANGVTLARMLRARFGEGVPVLLATADRSDEVAQSARSSGLDVLYKPLRPAGLRSWLNRVGRLHEAYSVSADADAASMGPTAMTT